jgi:hypothetical protein
MAINYTRNSIGSAAFIALSVSRGTNVTLTPTELSDLEADVDTVLATAVANGTILALGVSTEGSPAVQAIGSAIESAISGLSVRGASPAELTLLGTQFAALYTSCAALIAGGIPVDEAVGSAAFTSFAAGRGASETLTTTQLADLVADVTAVLTATEANVTLDGLEPGVAGDAVVQAVYAATRVATSGISVHGASALEMTALATQIAALYTGLVAHMGANFITNAIAAAAFIAMAEKRGASGTLSTNELADLLADVDTVVTLATANATIFALIGGAQDAAGMPGVKALTAAVRSALTGTNIRGLSTAAKTALGVQLAALYTASFAHMGPTA